MKRLFSLLLTLLAAPAFAQWPQSAQWDKVALPGLAKPGTILKLGIADPRLLGALKEGEVAAAFTPIPPAKFSPAPPTVDSFRLVRFSVLDGALAEGPAVPAGLRTLEVGKYALTMPPEWKTFRSSDRIGLLVRLQKAVIGSSTPTTVWQPIALSQSAPPSRGPTPYVATPKGSFSLDQELIGGNRTTVGRVALEGGVRNVLPVRNGLWTDFEAAGTLSTQRLDPDGFGRVELGFGRAYGPSRLDNLWLRLGARAAQSGRAAAGYAALGTDFYLPGDYPRSFTALVLGAAPVISVAARAENRWKRDEDASPYHVSPGAAYAMLRAQIQPLWLFPRDPDKGSFRTDLALAIDARGYYFPNDGARAGLRERRFEGYLGLDLSLPYPILNLVPNVYLRTGAFESQGFDRNVVFGIGLSKRL